MVTANTIIKDLALDMIQRGNLEQFPVLFKFQLNTIKRTLLYSNISTNSR